MPPTVLRRIDQSEKTPACHNIGTQPPIVEPTHIPNQMTFLLKSTSSGGAADQLVMGPVGRDPWPRGVWAPFVAPCWYRPGDTGS